MRDMTPDLSTAEKAWLRKTITSVDTGYPWRWGRAVGDGFMRLSAQLLKLHEEDVERRASCQTP